MSTFFRNIVGTVLVIGLCLVTGCTTTHSGSQQKSIFSLPKAKQKQEKSTAPTSMEQVLKMERVR